MALHRLIALVVLTSCLPENLVKGQSSLALEEQYNWLIRRVVAPTSRWGNGEAPGGCENGCEKENYLRIPGTADPRKAKTLKILVIMER